MRTRISFNYYSRTNTHLCGAGCLLCEPIIDSNVGSCELFEINAVAGPRERIAGTKAIQLFQILDRTRLLLNIFEHFILKLDFKFIRAAHN